MTKYWKLHYHRHGLVLYLKKVGEDFYTYRKDRSDGPRSVMGDQWVKATVSNTHPDPMTWPHDTRDIKHVEELTEDELIMELFV